MKAERLKPTLPGVLLGAALAGPPSAVVGHAGGVPIELLTWIRDNGTNGFLLAALALVTSFAVWLLRERLESEAATRAKQEQLLREQVEITRTVVAVCDRGTEAQAQTTHALNRNSRVIEALHLEDD